MEEKTRRDQSNSPAPPMPLARALSEESERPLWVPELPDRPASAEDAFSRAIEHSEDEGLRFLDDLQSGRSRWSPARVLGNDSVSLRTSRCVVYSFKEPIMKLSYSELASFFTNHISYNFVIL